MGGRRPEYKDPLYEDYKELSDLLGAAERSLESNDLEQAEEDLTNLAHKTTIMWGTSNPAVLPIESTDTWRLQGDVKDRNNEPPAGDFLKRLEALREAYRSKYRTHAKRYKSLKDEDFAPEGAEDPPM